MFSVWTWVRKAKQSKNVSTFVNSQRHMQFTVCDKDKLDSIIFVWDCAEIVLALSIISRRYCSQQCRPRRWIKRSVDINLKKLGGRLRFSWYQTAREMMMSLAWWVCERMTRNCGLVANRVRSLRLPPADRPGSHYDTHTSSSINQSTQNKEDNRLPALMERGNYR